MTKFPTLLCLSAPSPGRLLIKRCLSEPPERMNRASISRHRVRRKERTWWLIHKRHKFVRKTWHRAANANSADVRAPAKSSHPAALPHVALDHGPPASKLHDALNGAIFLRELGLLVVTTSITSFMDCLTEQPSGP